MFHRPGQVTAEPAEAADTNRPAVCFDIPGNHLICLECCGSVKIPVKARPHNNTFRVSFSTREGSASDYTEFRPASGTLEFPPSVTEQIQFLEVGIIDDDIFEPDCDFYVDLTPYDLDVVGDSKTSDGRHAGCEVVGGPLTVTIMDDDDPGLLLFENETVSIESNMPSVDIKIRRRSGGNGKVEFDLETEDGTAKQGIDFEGFKKRVALDHEVGD
jgi:hypothetical protein